MDCQPFLRKLIYEMGSEHGVRRFFNINLLIFPYLE